MNPVQAPAMEGEPLPDPEPDGDDVPLAKRRKAMPAEKSSPGAEVSLPTQSPNMAQHTRALAHNY